MEAIATPRLSVVRGALLLCAFVLVFLFVNRGSYHGYFQADDLDNMTWAPKLRVADYLEPIWKFRYEKSNFRPAGHFYYHAVLPFAGLDFARFLAPLHVLNCLNALLLWLSLRQLRFDRWAASAGTVLFGLHYALFDAFWKPMFVFDVLCASFLLATFLLYTRGHWIVALLTFYLAYRAKELAIFFPVVLLAYEWLFAGRRWKPLVPYFALSAWFGAQAMLYQRYLAQHLSESSYRLSVGLPGLAKAVMFYAKHAGLVSFGGLLLLVLLWRVRDRRLYFGAVTFALLLFPMVLLSSKLLAVYLYVPMFGFAILFAAVAQQHGRTFTVSFIVIWLGVAMYQMRSYSEAELAIAQDHRSYVADLDRVLMSLPRAKNFLARGRPQSLDLWGISGAIEILARNHGVEWTEHEVTDYTLRARDHNMPAPPYVVLDWNAQTHHMQASSQ